MRQPGKAAAKQAAAAKKQRVGQQKEKRVEKGAAAVWTSELNAEMLVEKIAAYMLGCVILATSTSVVII